MGRNKSPVPYTCPLIDRVIKTLDFELTQRDIDECVNTLEEIRSHNDSLRVWGTELLQEKEHLESEVEDLRYNLEREESKVRELEDEISQLKKELECLT